MAAQTFRKKPVTIEAMQFDGSDQRTDELYSWCTRPAEGFKGATVDLFLPLWWDDAEEVLGIEKHQRFMSVEHATAALYVDANNSWLPLTVGEWVAKDRHGFYPIKDDVFRESYELVTDP